MRTRNSALATLTNAVTNRRKFLKSMTAGSLGLFSGSAAFSANKASANGQVGYVAIQGAELFVHPTNLTPMLYMDVNTPVDVLFGPHEGLYQVRYYGTDGWIWADYLSLDGAPAASGNYGGGVAAPVVDDGYSEPVVANTNEHWIDVNRSAGETRLMIGNETYASFWASLGWEETSHGFYATAIGTYYIYGFRYELHYTPYADNYITHWVAFDPERFNGFHSYTKDQHGHVTPTGHGLTAGCVALAAGDIDQLYDFAQMNMRVEVHW